MAVKTLLIQKKDFKAVSWAIHSSKFGWEVEYIESSPILFFITFLKLCVKNKCPDVICFRYLNDYNSLGKTIFRAGSELLSILLARILKVKIVWICHNVDRESIEHHPKITRFRRRIISGMSSIIFVTDDLLIKYAIKQFPEVDYSIFRSLSFGPTPNFNSHLDGSANPYFDAAHNFYLKAKAESKAVGLWIGNPSAKSLGNLVFIAKTVSMPSNEICFIVIGSINDILQESGHQYIIDVLNNNPNVLYIDFNLDLPPCHWKDVCDFVFKTLDDLSVPLTYYNAAYAKVQIGSFDNSFGAEFITHYGLGFCFNKHDTISAGTLSELSFMHFDEFVTSHNWLRGAGQLFSTLDEVID